MTITTTRRLGALALVAAFAIGACGPAPARPARASSTHRARRPRVALRPQRPQRPCCPPACPSPTSIRSSAPSRPASTTGLDGQEIATALGSTTTFPDAPLSITAPGEESGTFDSFVELVLEGPAEARTIPEDQWTTRPDYTSSSNDNAIVDGVSGSAGSLGWVGFAFFEENLDTLRAFEIAEEAGGTCVAADGRDDRLERLPDRSRPVHLRQQGQGRCERGRRRLRRLLPRRRHDRHGPRDRPVRPARGRTRRDPEAPGRPARPAPRRTRTARSS